MHEKDMVSDILSGTKASLASYAKVIMECNDNNLRSTFQQMRDSDEKFQYDLYKIAAEKGYYVCGPQATQEQCSSIKQSLSQGSSWS